MMKLFILALFFLDTLNPPLDYDLGWHLRYGEHFFTTGQVLKDNIYSFVWPDYQWVQASWMYDLILYQISTHVGLFGISLAGALISMLVFLLITHPIKRFGPFQLFFLVAIFLSQAAGLFSAGMRSQTPSTLFFALAVIIGHTQRGLFFLPLLFLAWANFHGGFSLGLILLSLMWSVHGLLLLFKKVTKKAIATVPAKTWALFGLSLGLSWATPLVNPWGIRIYEETFKHSSNTNLSVITEWMPLTSLPIETTIALLIALLVLSVAWTKKRAMDIPFIAAYLIMLYLSLSASRFLMLFALMSTYYLAQHMLEMNWRILRMKPLMLGLKILLIAAVAFDLYFLGKYFNIPNPRVLTFSWEDYCNHHTTCSEGVTRAMLSDPPKGAGFHPYNYGGYLIWRVPHVKTFVDGRMAAWEENGKSPPVVEGDNILYEERPITFRRFDSQYHFQWAIVLPDSPISAYLDELVKLGQWEKRYEDWLFAYYVKVR